MKHKTLKNKYNKKPYFCYPSSPPLSPQIHIYRHMHIHMHVHAHTVNELLTLE